MKHATTESIATLAHAELARVAGGFDKPDNDAIQVDDDYLPRPVTIYDQFGSYQVSGFVV